MRGILFYVTAALVAAAMIAASLGPRLWASAPSPQAGQAQADGWIAFGPEALAQVSAEDAQVKHVVPTGVRVATRAGFGEPLMHQRGATLALAPETRAALAQRPILVEVDVRSLGVTQADALRVGAVGGIVTEWAEPQPLSAEPQTLRFRLTPPSEGALEAVGFWPQAAREDYSYGVEIVAVRLRPADA